MHYKQARENVYWQFKRQFKTDVKRLASAQKTEYTVTQQSEQGMLYADISSIVTLSCW